MKIEIDDDHLDKIIEETIINDFRRCKERFKYLNNKAATDGLTPWDEEDYQANKNYLIGFKHIMSYYVCTRHEVFEEL